MEVKLYMVGHYRNKNVTIKGVQFVNGVGMVRGADELVGNICKYLTNYGAFPLHEAERRQGILDQAAGRQGDLRGVRRRLEEAERAAAEARQELQSAMEESERRAKEQEDADVTVETQKSPEQGRNTSSRRSRNQVSSKDTTEGQ